MSGTIQRKRRARSSMSQRGAKRSRSPAMSSTQPAETIDILESDRLIGEEVVDLTSEGSEPAVVDLTNNDSVVVVDEGPQRRHEQGTESFVLSSDEEEVTPVGLTCDFLSSLHDSTRARSRPGSVSCPICMDSYSEVIDSGRLMVSTKCGHLFCSQCLRDSLSHVHSCPTCRKKLTHKQYHPIYI
ncbi:E3 ubiquitin-protein ligase RNF4 [Denticeps clupeoides]|uniref:RING-type domain-containing protein n=1 Tax=Denticeps clupeoides TaxID=299321 RepID=A0AAY4EZB3_9TELE|nr:E3 ubiquitin-protein ligase RNF4 [Denticeps clupeoides]